MAAPDRYEVDPSDPRAPDLETWALLSPSERRRVIDALPSELDLGPPEGDPHRLPKQQALDTLETYFRRSGRRVYLSSELPVYYPGERVFAPDLIAVCNVPSHPREKWVVAEEGKGLDLALEVTLGGSRKKDLEENVVRFARLGVPEYFVFDRGRFRLHGWRLPAAGGAYDPIIPQQGRWRSDILGLELAIEGERFRFFAGTAVVLETNELLERANALVDDLQARLDASERRAEAAESRLAELEAELSRLKKERP